MVPESKQETSLQYIEILEKYAFKNINTGSKMKYRLLHIIIIFIVFIS